MICSYDIFIASSYLLCSLFASSRSIRNMYAYKKKEQFKDNDNNNNNNNNDDDSGWWTHKNH